MKKVKTAILISFSTLILCSFSYTISATKEKSYENTKMLHYIIGMNNTVSASLRFVCSDRNTSQKLEGVKLIVIKNDEKVDILTTDKNGQAEKKISASLDKKYFNRDSLYPMQRGTVTVVAYKEGYRETILFEVPVSPDDSYQPFSMCPVVFGQRNEAVMQIGEIHHIAIGELVDKYRQYLNGK